MSKKLNNFVSSFSPLQEELRSNIFKNIILKDSADLSNLLDDIVFIGGVATYSHTNQQFPLLTEPSHDADLVMSRQSYQDLKEIEDMSHNHRLAKSQFIKNDIAYDIYVAGEQQLMVSHENLLKFSTVVNGIRVACPEHLLTLKLHAALARQNCPKGHKDCRDLFRLVCLLSNPRPEALKINPIFMKFLENLSHDQEDLLVITKKNSHEAHKLKELYDKNLKIIKEVIKTNNKNNHHLSPV